MANKSSIAEQVAKKHLYHKWGPDGFCMNGCRIHRTDMYQQSPLCYVLVRHEKQYGPQSKVL